MIGKARKNVRRNDFTDQEVDAHVEAHVAAAEARAAGLDVVAKPPNRQERRKHQIGGRHSSADRRMWLKFGEYAHHHGRSFR